ncbi:MAG: DUF3483 domain-containing protein [Alphaproteobacteria bacterium]|nr:DUF3483 domain-containing protein [Alphaproteobacteria bacterium]
MRSPRYAMLAGLYLVGLVLAPLAMLLPLIPVVQSWRLGRPAAVDWVHGLQHLPARLAREVRGALARRREAARLHAAAAGGFAATYVLGLWTAAGGGLAVELSLVAASSLLIAGAVLAARRPRRGTGAPLPGGGYRALPWALGAFGGWSHLVAWECLGVIAPFDWGPGAFVPIVAIGGAALVFLVVGMSRGPMRHALAGLVYIAAHPRPARFADAGPGRDMALRPEEGGASPGASTIDDFAWNLRAGFDACVRCGRCQDACPAFAANLPLNPMALVLDLSRAAEGRPVRLRGQDYHPGLAPPGTTAAVALAAPGGAIRPETLWACTTCGACVDACPMQIETLDAIMALRRSPSAQASMPEPGRQPGRAAPDMPEARCAWAADLGIPVLGTAEKPLCDVLLWQGDAAFTERGRRSLRALAKLLQRAGVDFAILGDAETDCGDAARRLGRESAFRAQAAAVQAVLDARRFRRMVTIDPHALHCFKHEYPALGVRLWVLHHTQLLALLLDERRLPRVAADDQSAALLEPCYLVRHVGESEAPQAVLRAAGLSVVTPERQDCCGWGGGVSVTDEPAARAMAAQRRDALAGLGASTIAVACPGCAEILADDGPGSPAVADVAELLLAAIERQPALVPAA